MLLLITQLALGAYFLMDHSHWILLGYLCVAVAGLAAYFVLMFNLDRTPRIEVRVRYRAAPSHDVTARLMAAQS